MVIDQVEAWGIKRGLIPATLAFVDEISEATGLSKIDVLNLLAQLGGEIVKFSREADVVIRYFDGRQHKLYALAGDGSTAILK